MDGVRKSLAATKPILAHYRRLGGTLDPATECLDLIAGRGPARIQKLLGRLEPAWADHTVASVYALLMPRARRKTLGAYFTPPHLVEHLLLRMRMFGLDPSQHRIRDPAAGGSAFLVPLAREMISSWQSESLQPSDIVSRLRSRLVGREIDSGLAAVSNALVRRMLVSEFAIPHGLVSDLELVEVANSLLVNNPEESDHEVGNPPYLRLDAAGHRQWKVRFKDIVSGRLNLYAIFSRLSLDEVPRGGLVGHILPPSFLGGPEFSTFRARILQLAEVLALDLVEKRRGVFLGATQDACLLILRKRPSPIEEPQAANALSGVLHEFGDFAPSGEATLTPDGSPWSLPEEYPTRSTATLADYGYRCTVGYLVSNRQWDRLHKTAAEGTLPLVWAKCITSEGLFDFDRGRNSRQAKGFGFVRVPRAGATYAIRVQCVLVQRTSARSQSRRLNAAAVPAEFVERYGGIVGENHVIILVPERADAVAPSTVADVLNSPQANSALARICGSASISVRLLERLPLPSPVNPSLHRQLT